MMELAILTTAVVVLFLVFGIAIYRELDKDYDPRTKEMGPRADMVNFIGKLFDEKQTIKEQVSVLKAMTRTISDMEDDGVYFSDSVKAELEKKRNELYCEYSNLPSVKSYES
jgi:hypothetical protein